MIASEVADAMNVGLSAFDKLMAAKKTLTPGSLVEISQASRVIAPCIYEQNLWYSDAQKTVIDVIRTAENLYTGFYLLALNTIMPVGKIGVNKVLGQLSPNRNEKINVSKLILESADSKDFVFLDAESKPINAATSSDDIEMLNDNANIATGKFLTVTLTDGTSTVKMPISIRMRVAHARSEVMEAVLAVGGAQNSFKNRWHRMMAGEIAFWDDMIWSSDLVRESKKIMRMDENGVLKAVQTARLRAIKSAASTNIASSGAIASTYIISSDTLSRLERKIGRSIRTNFAIRQKLMEESLAMQLIVIDPKEEMVSFFFHSIEDETTASFKQLEKSGKKSDGSDLLSILQALRTGNVPQIR